MKQYINVDNLKEEIKKLSATEYGDNTFGDDVANGALDYVLEEIIPSLQQEQPEYLSNLVDVDAVREDFMTEVYRVLDADPTNDRANAIINAFDSLPTVSQEQMKVDLEKEIDAVWNPRFNLGWDEKSLLSINRSAFETIARHFYELGLSARKEE